MKQKIMTFIEGTLLMMMLISVSALDGKNFEIPAVLTVVSVIGLFVCYQIEQKNSTTNGADQS